MCHELSYAVICCHVSCVMCHVSSVMCHVSSSDLCQVVSVTEDGTRTAARVVDPDIAATNGVVHAIDTVI